MGGTFELDGFEPISRIGGGGFGDVWLCRQTNVDREVAIKVGHAPLQDETIKVRFERECKALGRLSGHNNIVEVYTAGTLKDGRPYLVLEYIGGGTLWQKLKAGPLSESELIKIGHQMAAALHVAHSTGILHRDLKPENILMRPNGDTVLGDFGIARLQDGVNTTSAAITASVAYAAPEVLSGSRATVASDLYGLGVCLLAAILQTVPFVQKTDESIHPIINRVLSEAHPDLRERGVSDELASIVDSLLDKNPAKRPSNAEEVVESFTLLEARAKLGGDDGAGVPLGFNTGPVPIGPDDQTQQTPAVVDDTAAAESRPMEFPSAGGATDGRQDRVTVLAADRQAAEVGTGQLAKYSPVATEPSLFKPFVLSFLATIAIGSAIIFAVYFFVLS